MTEEPYVLYKKGERDMKKVTLPSGATIITDITKRDVGTEPDPTLSNYELLILNRDLLLKIAEKLGVDVTP